MSAAAAPALPCPNCGVIEIPRISPGTGPHVAKATCNACHGFIKWLPKVMVKEPEMIANVNRCVLLGCISTYGVSVKYAPSGTPCTSFTLVLREQGQDAREHTTLVECECWGRKAEAAGELKAGQLVLFEGRLRKVKKGEDWTMVVSGFEVCPIRASAEDPS
jgi:primosomal replication protein N